MIALFVRIFSLFVLLAAGWLCVRQWEEGWSLQPAPDVAFPGLVATPAGLRPAPGSDLWRLANNHHLLARTLVHEATDLPLASTGILATSVLSPDLSGLLVVSLGLTPELAAVAVTPTLDRRLSAACPAVPPNLARRCNERGWLPVQQRLPSVLAGALLDGDDRLVVEVLGVACDDPTLAAGVADAIPASQAGRQGTPRPAALALFLRGCAEPGGTAARRSLATEGPVQWMAALELAGTAELPPPSSDATLTAALLRYSASISSRSTAVPSSP